MEIREEAKMDTERTTDNEAGIKSKMDVRDTATRDAAHTARGRPFKRGTSGNPNGRPKGHRNRVTMAMEELLLDGEAEGLTPKVIERALEGDMVAMRLCLERVLPPRRDRPVAFELPKIESANDVPVAARAILSACAAGALSPGEAAEIIGLLSTYARMFEDTEIEARMAALEKRMASP
jgi:hypothetical protein